MSYKYTPEEIGELNAEIDRLRTRVVKLEEVGAAQDRLYVLLEARAEHLLAALAEAKSELEFVMAHGLEIAEELGKTRAALAEAEKARDAFFKAGETIQDQWRKTKAALAKAERERDGARAQCRADIAAMQREIARAERAEADLVDKSRQIAELQEQLHHLYGVEQRAERDEAALAVAWEVIERAIAWCGDFNIDDAWTEDARAFLERANTLETKMAPKGHTSDAGQGVL